MLIQHLLCARHSREIHSPNPRENAVCRGFVDLAPEDTEKEEIAQGHTAHTVDGRARPQTGLLAPECTRNTIQLGRLPVQRPCQGCVARLEDRRQQEKAALHWQGKSPRR